MDSKYSGAAVSTDAQPDSDPAAWALGQAVRPPMPTLTCRAPLLSPMLSDLPRSANAFGEGLCHLKSSASPRRNVV